MRSKCLGGNIGYCGSYGRFKKLRDDVINHLESNNLQINDINDGTRAFLEQDDLNLVLNYKQCKMLLDQIKDMHSDYVYGFKKDNELTIEVFKDILMKCYKKRNNLYVG